ncbi:hypothetical protein DK45_4562 [Bordetella bronchiseptica]|nr:hypothetical protein DK45_4562 [Bordetella bronchiseptica]
MPWRSVSTTYSSVLPEVALGLLVPVMASIRIGDNPDCTTSCRTLLSYKNVHQCSARHGGALKGRTMQNPAVPGATRDPALPPFLFQTLRRARP